MKLQTTMNLVNKEDIQERLDAEVQGVYEHCKENGDLDQLIEDGIDISLLLESDDGYIMDAIEENFEEDEDGDMVCEAEAFDTLMKEIQAYMNAKLRSMG